MPKTEITPKGMFETRNTSDIFTRLVIMGLLRVLNKRLKYVNVWSDDEDGRVEVTVPFFFDFSGGSGSSERFIQDNYTFFTSDECTEMGVKKIDGNYSTLPYGVVTLESTQINSGDIANRFVMGEFQRKVGRDFRSFVAFLYSIPLSMSFTVSIGCDTMNTMMKIEQSFREYFYKNKTFRFNYRGTVVPCRVGFPESMSVQKNNAYGFGSQTSDGTPDIKISFQLSVETYQPVFDPFTERPAENMIRSFSSSMATQTEDTAVRPSGRITADGVDRAVIMSGEDVLLKWSWDYDRSDLLSVDIMVETEEDGMAVYDTVDNHSCYHLTFDEDFVGSESPFDLMLLNSEGVIMVNAPRLKFYCDDDGIVSARTCVVVDKGCVITDDTAMDAVLCYDKNGSMAEHAVRVNITNGAVDLENPVTMEDFVYRGEMKHRNVRLYVRDHYCNDIVCPLQYEGEWIKVVG